MTLADDLVTIDGLPLHPLVVHAVVVLLPLSAAGTVLIALRPAWRRRFGVVVAALTVFAVASVPVAQQTGEQLEERLEWLENPAIERHADLGETLLPFALVHGFLVLGFVLAGHLADRATPGNRGPWRLLVVSLAVLAVIAAVVTTVRVVQVGHSGSTAVWEGIADIPPP